MQFYWLVLEWLTPSTLLWRDLCQWQSNQSANHNSFDTEPRVKGERGRTGLWQLVPCSGHHQLHRCGSNIGPVHPTLWCCSFLSPSQGPAQMPAWLPSQESFHSLIARLWISTQRGIQQPLDIYMNVYISTFHHHLHLMTVVYIILVTHHWQGLGFRAKDWLFIVSIYVIIHILLIFNRRWLYYAKKGMLIRICTRRWNQRLHYECRRKYKKAASHLQVNTSGQLRQK